MKISVDGNGAETGHMIVTTIGGRNGQPKQTISYMAERVVGHASFGVVFQAKCLEIGERRRKKGSPRRDTRTENYKRCVYWITQTLLLKCPVHIDYKRSILIDFVARF